MMMLALAAAVLAAPDRLSCYNPQDWRPREEEAMCQFTVLNTMPELMQFRNVRVVGDYVCGEVNEPSQKKMLGFQPFVYKDRDNWVQMEPWGPFGKINGSTRGSDSDHRMHEALRKGNRMEAEAYRLRKAEYNAAANELLGACSKHLDAD